MTSVLFFALRFGTRNILFANEGQSLTPAALYSGMQEGDVGQSLDLTPRRRNEQPRRAA
jgi:hypothetical protein